MTNVTFKTPKGNQYVYEVFSFGTSFNSVAGNYMFAYQTQNGYWYPAYIGQTNDLSARLPNHETLPSAKQNGATHILAHVQANEQARKNEEEELIAWLKPACNKQLK